MEIKSRGKLSATKWCLSALLVMPISASAASGEKCSQSGVLEKLKTLEIHEIKRVSQAPRETIAAFDRVIAQPGEPRMVDPGRSVRSTDFGLPGRRLVLGGSVDSITFLLYEKGGRVISVHLFVTCKDDHDVSTFSQLGIAKCETVDCLRASLDSTRFVSPAREGLRRGGVKRSAPGER